MLEMYSVIVSPAEEGVADRAGLLYKIKDAAACTDQLSAWDNAKDNTAMAK